MTSCTVNRSTWPAAYDVLGARISGANCDEACEAILRAAHNGEAAIVSAFSVHALIEAVSSPELQVATSRFAMVVADGQPVRWALNWLHGVGMQRNVRGSDLMWQLCARAAQDNVSIYLYGGESRTIVELVASLRRAFATLVIAGAESPPFRPLSIEEEKEMVARVNASGARLMFIGLGCPKQDYFAVRHASSIRAVQICVGAAFDFHAGTKPTAPAWMQAWGLEWLFRLYQEPRRLWRRYLVTNSQFIARLLPALVCQRVERWRTFFRRASAPVCKDESCVIHHVTDEAVLER